MLGTTLQRSETTRESKVRALVFFLTLSVLLHGTFYTQEWIILGTGMAFLSAWTVWGIGLEVPGKKSWKTAWGASEPALAFNISLTDGLFFGLIVFSLIGLIQPVKVSEGWLDAIRWLTLWMTYRVALTIREEQTHFVLRWIEGLGVFLGIVGGILSLSYYFIKASPVVDGRLSSLFGYPNALAAFCGAVLLLKPRSIWVRAILFTSLLNTGSRAALVIFLVIWCSREILFWMNKRRHNSVKSKARVFKERLFFIVLLSLGTILTFTLNPQALGHLFNWGISASLGERILYIWNGIQLAILNKGVPQAGGWLAFPLVQNIPYWTTDPHSLGIRILLHQGVPGFILAGIWGFWVLRELWRERLRTFQESRNSENRLIRGASTLIFLGVHSLVDTDFLFGALGILFWLLFGMFFSPRIRRFYMGRTSYHLNTFYTRKERGSKKGLLVLLGIPFIGLGLFLLATSVNLQWIEPEKAVNDKVAKLQESLKLQDNFQAKAIPFRRLELLEKSIQLDQTQYKVRQEIARLELDQKGSAGLARVEDVIAWKKFDLRTYEWAQGLVFEKAEECKESNPKEALELYRWVESIPRRITSIREISPFEKKLWLKGENFQPSDLNWLLANYAKERQLSLH
jgi:hypothetical protein